MYTRKQLAEKAPLADLDLVEVERCRGNHNRLGFAYQIGFVKLLNRFPAQRPLEVIDELNIFTGIQLGLPLEAKLVARSRPGPLGTGPYVVFLQQSGRYP